MGTAIFLAGKRLYVITAPAGNIMGLVFTCISVVYIAFQNFKWHNYIILFIARDTAAIQRTQN